MGRGKSYPPGERICNSCGVQESSERPFLARENKCKRCQQDYNTRYQRDKRGHNPQSKMSPEEELKHRRESAKRWRENNPDKAAKMDKKQHDKQYLEDAEKVKQRNSDWQKANLEWRRQYLRDWRAKKRAEKAQQ